MPESAKFILFSASAVILCCIVKMVKSGHFIKAFTVSALSGFGSLVAINLVSFITGIKLSINWFTIAFCSFAGISGSISLLLINIIKTLSL